MKAIVIDDENLAREYVKSCIRKHGNIEIVAECGDGFEGLKAIQEHQPDIIFLDIQMPRINGFEMLELIENPPQVIFTTAFDEFAMKAFEANAIDYLLKPFSQERFDRALLKIQNQTEAKGNLNEAVGKSAEEANRIVLRHQGEIRIIPAQDILYIEAWDDYVKIHTQKETFVKKKTLTYYENSLQHSDFIRCHRSYLVNIKEISAIDHSSTDAWELRLRNGFHLPASKQGYGRLKEVLGL